MPGGRLPAAGTESLTRPARLPVENRARSRRALISVFRMAETPLQRDSQFGGDRRAPGTALGDVVEQAESRPGTAAWDSRPGIWG